jgi:hypothetical protein
MKKVVTKHEDDSTKLKFLRIGCRFATMPLFKTLPLVVGYKHEGGSGDCSVLVWMKDIDVVTTILSNTRAGVILFTEWQRFRVNGTGRVM